MPLMFRTAAAIAAISTLPDTALAQTQRMPVTVLDAAGAPVRDALVCAGSDADRALYGAARTDGQGRASIPIAAPAQQNVSGVNALPPMAATVTASVQLAGVTRGGSIRGAIASGVTVRLQATGGPACPAGTVPTSAPGTQPINRADVLAGIANQPDRPIGTLFGPPRRVEHCFGAAGQQCMDSWNRVGTCVLGSCLVNAGSWKHDECCYADTTGYLCSGKFEQVLTPPPGGGNPGMPCQVEFYTAFTRLGSIFTWRRNVDFSVGNSSGTVDHAAYCAPAGQTMFQGEDAMCCSRRTRAPNAIEAVAIAAARATNLFLPRATPARICAA